MLLGIVRNHHYAFKKKKEGGMHRTGSVRSLVLISRVRQKPPRPVGRGRVKAVTVTQAVFRLPSGFLSSCAKTDGEARCRVKPALLWSCLLCHCASSWWFGWLVG